VKKYRYVVLQDINASERGGGHSTLGNNTKSIVPPELTALTAEMTPTQAAEELKNPNTLNIARDMPLSLIEPFSSGASGPLEQISGSSTWGVAAIGADKTEHDGNGVTVAVLDTGIKADHPAFVDPALELVQKNFTSEGNHDMHGHGTHCAGTIFGRDITHQGQSVRIGVAPGVKKALIGKVLGAGAGTAELIQAITWARAEGADVISMSLGYNHAGLLQLLCEDFPPAKAASELLAIYLENMRQFDTLMTLLAIPARDAVNPLIVAASGNESEATAASNPYRISASSPSAALHVVSVGALAQTTSGKLDVAPFSNTSVDLVAPGVSVISANLNDSLVPLSGTSMATPHVAGLAALYCQRMRALGLPQTGENVRGQLVGGAVREPLVEGVTIGDVGMGMPLAPPSQ